MSEWKEVSIMDVTSKIGDGLHGTPNYDNFGDYYFINGNNLNQGKIVVKPETQKVNKFEYLKHCKPLSDNTILVGINGTIGNVAIYKNEKCILGKSACFINVNEKVLRKYFYYVILNKDFQNFLTGIATGTTIPNVPLKGLREYTFKLPPLPEQTAIAEILSCLDDKIDLLHRQNKTLEQLAETLFRQWFIEEAEEGWEEATLNDEFDFTMGQSPSGIDLNESGNGMIFFQGRSDFGFRFPQPRVFTTAPTRKAFKYDTLISVRAPVGDMNMAFEDCCLGRGVAAFRYKTEKGFYSYTYYKLRSLMEHIKQFEDNGSVFGSIGKEDFEKIENRIPPKNLIEKFQKTAKPIDQKIFTNHKQIMTLTQLREILLPKLMSGEIRVKG